MSAHVVIYPTTGRSALSRGQKGQFQFIVDVLTQQNEHLIMNYR